MPRAGTSGGTQDDRSIAISAARNASTSPPRCASCRGARLPQLARELRGFLLASVAQDRRPSVVQPRHGRADRRAALRIRHAARPPRLGRRPPDVCAQDPDRPPRSDEPSADGRRSLRFPAPHRKRIRHVRHRAFVDVDLRCARHGDRGAAQGRRRGGRRGDRRRRDERRHGIRGAEQRRRRGGRPARHPERQRHVDLGAGRRAQQPSRARCCRAALYNNVRRGGKEVLSLLPPVRQFAKRFESHTKGMVLPGTLFEELGFNYIGPIDGHDLDALVATLANVKALKGPQFLHVITRKGHGYARAEADPILYHGVTRFDPAVGIVPKAARQADLHAGLRRLGYATWRRAIRGWSASRRRCAKARGSCASRKEYPDRYFDVGIAEQHAVTFAAGLACEGMKPVVAIYSTFLQRGYDQLVHDVALQNLPVLFAIDRAGVVGADGATHVGAFDLSLPALPAEHGRSWRRPTRTSAGRCSTPASRSTARSPFAIRAAAVRASPVVAAMTALPIGRAEVRRESARRITASRSSRSAACCNRRSPPAKRSTRRSSTCASSSRSTSTCSCGSRRSIPRSSLSKRTSSPAVRAVRYAEALIAAGITVPIAASRPAGPLSRSRRSRGDPARVRPRWRRNRGGDPAAFRCAATQHGVETGRLTPAARDECVYDGNIARIADASARSSGNVTFTLNALPTTARGFRPSASTACASSVKPSSPGSANARRSTP